MPIGTANAGSGPNSFTNVNNKVFFSAVDGRHGRELWVTDGDASGTMLFKDINANAGSDPQELRSVNGSLFFTADDGVLGRELWASDGTAVGTRMVKDITPDGQNGSPRYLTDVDGTLFFTANDGQHGTELWKSDGTAAGTKLIKDILPAGHSVPSHLTDVDGTLFFTAHDELHGTELWKSDGTEASTVLVKDIEIGPTGTYADSLADVDGTLFFRIRGALWKSDGTESGTVLVRDFDADGSYPRWLTPVGETLFFVADEFGFGNQLWKSDGTAAGTVLVRDTLPERDNRYAPRSLTDVNGTLFFRGYEQMFGYQLWKSDGSTAGMVVVQDAIANLSPSDLTNVGGKLYFTVHTGTTSARPWQSDGTGEGTVAIADHDIGIGGAIGGFAKVGDRLLFYADDSIHGYELWTLQLEIPSSHGDFNGDHLHNCADVDALDDTIHAGTNDATYDLTGDLIVDRDDLDAWLAEAATANGYQQPYVRGDATLDGRVDAADLNVVGLNWRKPVNGWCLGDFDANAVVDASDLNHLGVNWRSDIAVVAPAKLVAEDPQAVLGHLANARTPRAPLAAIALPVIAERFHGSSRSLSQHSLPANPSDWQIRNRLEESIPRHPLAATAAAGRAMSRAAIARRDLARILHSPIF